MAIRGLKTLNFTYDVHEIKEEKGKKLQAELNELSKEQLSMIR